MAALRGHGGERPDVPPRELETIEADILAAEGKAALMETALASPDFYAKNGHNWDTFEAQLETGKAEVARLYARWEELQWIANGA